MKRQPKILAFAGSLREESYNKKLVKIAIQGARDEGAIVTYIYLRDYPLPLYDQEIEDAQGLPDNALRLKELMQTHDGFLLACPEYNSSMSAVFKNVIDWTSRNATKDEVYLSCFINKAVTLMSASPGVLGGLRGLVHVRAMFSNLFSLVLPRQKSLPKADQAFDVNGHLLNEKDREEVIDLGRGLARFLRSQIS